ncbi:Uncharacterised protein [Mycobacteroides abscessus subsp. abscessus]|nr:Uncharacterised protein [Mycobacteroides abscessus subsp. abscessus]
MEPPDNPVPAPRGTTEIWCALAHLRVAETSSVLRGRTTASGIPASGSKARSCRYEAVISGSVMTAPSPRTAVRAWRASRLISFAPWRRRRSATRYR